VYAATVTLRRWLYIACKIHSRSSRRGCGIGGWYTCLSHIPIGRSPGIKGAKEWVLLVLSKPLGGFPPSKKSVIGLWKGGGASSCLKWSCSRKFSFYWGHNHCSSVYRYVIPATLASAKKKGPYIFVFDTTKNTLTFVESLITSHFQFNFRFVCFEAVLFKNMYKLLPHESRS
jgi:hypothetical protein